MSQVTGQRLQRGFTLLELLVTILVVAVLMGTAVGGIRNMLDRNILAAEVNNLVMSLRIARAEAVKRNKKVVICKGQNAEGCSPNANTTVTWNDGWLVYVDCNGDLNPNSPSKCQRIQRGEPHSSRYSVSLVGSNLNTYVEYFPAGYPNTSVTFQINAPNNTNWRKVVVSPSGRITIEKPW
ncbi:GspH/FimT family pseudopilin [Alcanivorax sp.]|uniref:GspH/FimT family pseudopilin n=1 Tax=Alcanivorax sp. TaxID=1872427 RepID=UPI00258D4957|nr:GspH/FimT family pseudopilin [Alcanivorax sp.]